MRERYLGEIKTIYPESYEFAYEQRPKVAQHNKTNKSEYELIIRPLLDNGNNVFSSHFLIVLVYCRSCRRCPPRCSGFATKITPKALAIIAK